MTLLAGWALTTTPRRQVTSTPAAKFAYQDTPEKRIARKLLTESPHLGIDNIEVLNNTVSASSSKLVAFNTLAEAMQAFCGANP